jgi:hypothetical protein
MFNDQAVQGLGWLGGLMAGVLDVQTARDQEGQPFERPSGWRSWLWTVLESGRPDVWKSKRLDGWLFGLQNAMEQTSHKSGAKTRREWGKDSGRDSGIPTSSGRWWSGDRKGRGEHSTMKRFRLSTLMLLVVIAALVIALVVEKRRSAILLVQQQVIMLRERNAQANVARFQAQAMLDQAAETTSDAKPNGSPSKWGQWRVSQCRDSDSPSGGWW